MSRILPFLFSFAILLSAVGLSACASAPPPRNALPRNALNEKGSAAPKDGNKGSAFPTGWQFAQSDDGTVVATRDQAKIVIKPRPAEGNPPAAIAQAILDALRQADPKADFTPVAAVRSSAGFRVCESGPGPDGVHRCHRFTVMALRNTDQIMYAHGSWPIADDARRGMEMALIIWYVRRNVEKAQPQSGAMPPDDDGLRVAQTIDETPADSGARMTSAP